MHIENQNLNVWNMRPVNFFLMSELNVKIFWNWTPWQLEITMEGRHRTKEEKI